MFDDLSAIDDDIGESTDISIVMLGDSSVGKSSLVKTFTNQNTNPLSIATIGIEQHSIKINFNDVNYSVKIWDTCGQERFRIISKNYLRSGDGLILVYDLTNVSTYNSLNKWLNDITESCKENIPIVIAENKNDLEREVDQKSSDELKKKYPNIPIFETNMNNKALVTKCFTKLIELIDNQIHLESSRVQKKQRKTLNMPKDKKANCCS